MVGFECLTEDSYNQLRNLNRKGIISDRAYRELEDCRNIKQINKVMLNNIRIVEDEMPKLMWYFVTKKWNDKRKKSEDTTFNEEQNKFIKQILLHNGVYERDECQKSILTEQQIRNQINQLEEMKIIVSIKTKKSYDNKTIYIINPEIIKEVRGEI